MSPPLISHPWGRAVRWLLFLVPTFFVTYGLSNWVTGLRTEVGAFYWDWERNIPFWPWTIVPYMSIDLFYGVSLFLCRTREELDCHARRLLAATVVSILGFLLFPLHFSFERPDVAGFYGWLFEVLTGFDRPFNQAPSLHISLLLILWVKYTETLPPKWRWGVHGWFFLIALSVVTTFQHHVIDFITGFWAGVFCLYLFPDGGQGWSNATWCADRHRRRIGGYYLAGGTVLAGLAFVVGGWCWWVLWPAVSLLLVAAGYGFLGPAVFRKEEGRFSLAARLLLGPYLLGAWLSHYYYTRAEPPWREIAEGVRLGRPPRTGETEQYGHYTVIDMTGELANPAAKIPECAYYAIPCLDLVPPSAVLLRAIAEIIERERPRGGVLVHCALGRGRSAAAVAAWLLVSRRATSAEAAWLVVGQHRPGIVWNEATRRAVVLAATDAPKETYHD